MKNKIILSSGALFHHPIKEIFYIIAKHAEFDGLELIIDDNIDSTDINKLKKNISKFNVPILSVHAPLDNCEVFGNEANEIVSRTLKIVKSLGSKVAVFHPSRKNFDMYRDELLLSLEANQSSRIKLVVENKPKNKDNVNDNFFYDPEQLERFFRDICLDTSHLATTKLDFNTKIKSVISSIKHVHLADSNFVSEGGDYFVDEHLPCLTGKLDLGWFTQELKKIE